MILPGSDTYELEQDQKENNKLSSSTPEIYDDMESTPSQNMEMGSYLIDSCNKKDSLDSSALSIED